jgi:hypothetical protein
VNSILFRIIILGLGISCLTACSSFSTIPPKYAGENDINPNRINGILYFLPRGLVHIVGGAKPAAADTSKNSPPGTPAPGAAPAPTAAASGQGSLAVTPNYTLTITSVIEPDPSACYYLKPDRNYLFDDSVDVKVDENGLLTSGKASAKDETVQIVADIAALVPQALTSLSASPDGNFRVSDFINMLNAQPGTNLVPVSAVTDLYAALPNTGPNHDVISDFVSSLAKAENVTVAQLRVFLALYPPATVLPDTADHKAVDIAKAFKKAVDAAQANVAPFDITFDPSRPASVQRAQGTVAKFCGFVLTVVPSSTAGLEFKTKTPTPEQENHSDGIAFRATTAFTVKLTSKTFPDFACHKVVILPDCSQTLLLDYSRMPFVQKDTNLGFQNGLLVEFAQNTPSPVLGFLGIPKAILTAILPIPAPSAKPSGTATK